MDYEEAHHELVKCVVVGDTAVGKTRLICARACDTRVTLEQLIVPHVPTVWAIDQYRIQRQVLERSFQTVDGISCSLRLWDTFGDHDKDRRFAYGNSDVCSFVSPSQIPAVATATLSNRACTRDSGASVPHGPSYLVGCKSGLRHMWKDEQPTAFTHKRGPLIRRVREADILLPEQGRLVANEIGAPYYETSAYTMFGVHTLFENIVRAALCSQRRHGFLMSHLKRVQNPWIQVPFCPPKPEAKTVVIPKDSLLTDDLRMLYEHKPYCDVLFLAQGTPIPAHRFLLAASCQTFYDLFTIDLSDVLPEAFVQTCARPSPIVCHKFNSDKEQLIESDSSSQTESDASSTQGFSALAVRKIVNHPAFEEIEVRYSVDVPIANLHLVITLNDVLSAEIFSMCLAYLYLGDVRKPASAHTMSRLEKAAYLLNITELSSSIENMHNREEFLNLSIKTRFLEKQKEQLRQLCLVENHFSDITFQLDDGTCCAHRALLMVRCDMMDAMLGGTFKERQEKLIPLPGVDLACFRAFLEYIYTDSISSVGVLEPVELMALANRLCLPHLLALIEQAVTRELGAAILGDERDVTEDLVTLLEPAQLHNAKQLARWCLVQLSIKYNELTRYNKKALHSLRPGNLAYLNLNRWPPVWYLNEVEHYQKCMRDNAALKLKLSKHRSGSGCLCFHKGDTNLTPMTARTRSALSKKLRQFSIRTGSFKFSFFPRTVPVWNSLPALVAEAPSLVFFKGELSRHSF
ncbi:PREDICTED: rho-related BTB domain-containing protein 1-like [Priapulus caudatus]|uniref:Rho-related BTB domain-containing protein 1-like n=1 Tax=Priapulus caudatus TaxID=37621 RepID=A0ABM1ELS0_PRICU|nr:PREDICTED: rho-related BTB domain-containing protein 1-like [Priapulus caudatus]